MGILFGPSKTCVASNKARNAKKTYKVENHKKQPADCDNLINRIATRRLAKFCRNISFSIVGRCWWRKLAALACQPLCAPVKLERMNALCRCSIRRQSYFQRTGAMCTRVRWSRAATLEPSYSRVHDRYTTEKSSGGKRRDMEYYVAVLLLSLYMFQIIHLLQSVLPRLHATIDGIDFDRIPGEKKTCSCCFGFQSITYSSLLYI